MTDPRIAFKAGRCYRRGNTNFVDADPAKGAIILQNGEDGLLHFIWKNRSTNTVGEVRVVCLQRGHARGADGAGVVGPDLVPWRGDARQGRPVCVGADVRPQVFVFQPKTFRESLSARVKLRSDPY